MRMRDYDEYKREKEIGRREEEGNGVKEGKIY